MGAAEGGGAAGAGWALRARRAPAPRGRPRRWCAGALVASHFARQHSCSNSRPRPPDRLSQGDNQHTIVLLQTGPGRSSRTFSDYETVPAAMDGALNKKFSLTPRRGGSAAVPNEAGVASILLSGRGPPPPWRLSRRPAAPQSVRRRRECRARSAPTGPGGKIVQERVLDGSVCYNKITKTLVFGAKRGLAGG